MGKSGYLLPKLALPTAVIVLLTLLSQTAFARTYVITDGERSFTHTSFSADPAEVLAEAGLELSTLDTYTCEETTSIVINRADRVNLCYRGQWQIAAIGEETVAQLLHRLNLPVGEGDILSHDPGEKVYGGMELRVDQVVTRCETYTSTIPYDILYCADASIPAGTQEVLTRGRDGEVLRTANVTYRNGKEVERKILTEEMTRHPVTEVIAQGRGEAPTAVDPNSMPIIGEGYIKLPTGEVLTYTRTDTVRATAYTHTDPGCDMVTATGTTVHRGTVAVDPRFIPYGTRMFIISNDGEYVYGMAVAEDCGGAIKRDRMDLYFPSHEECMDFGFRSCTIYFLG